MPRLRRLAPLFLIGTAACVSGTDASDAAYEGCASDLDCKDGRVCRDGACTDPVGEDAGPDTDIGRVVFRLSLAADASGPVYLQDTSPERDDAWLTLLRGPTGEYPQPTSPSCAYCFCGSCASCADLCGAALPSVRRLDPGEAADLRWDGTTFPIDSTCPGAGPCYNIRPAQEGGTYRARFCWSLAATGEGPDHELVPPIFCDERSFAYTGGQARLVEYAITEGA